MLLLAVALNDGVDPERSVLGFHYAQRLYERGLSREFPNPRPDQQLACQAYAFVFKKIRLLNQQYNDISDQAPPSLGNKQPT